MISFTVIGIPKGEARARARRAGPHARIYKPTDGPDANWRADVQTAALEHRQPGPPLHGPVAVWMAFNMPRPKGHYRTGKHAGQVKPGAPLHHDKKPDTDNLAKLVLDVLTGCGYWQDDCQVTQLLITKDWAEVGSCTVEIRPL